MKHWWYFRPSYSSMSTAQGAVVSELLPRTKKLKTWTAVWMVFVHAGACLAPFFFTWPAFFTFLFLYWLTCSVGICLTYHRLLTHRSFKLVKPIEYFFTLCGCIALQGGPVSWVGVHRMHHAHSDKEGDPHSPTEGFFWAHALWTVTYMKQFDTYSIFSQYAKDLTRDPGHRFLDSWHGPLGFGVAGVLYLIGGWPFVFWGFFMRLVVSYHATWLVNSASHVWGYRNFDCSDESKNNWLVAVLAFGEGWHNNHHAFQGSAQHGIKWWEFDATFGLIKLLSWLRLAEDVRIPDWSRMPAPPQSSALA